ncbi:hypothetical protein Pint_29556 [Pistacia integerrima]|uniref:Uncharacterized protein n=1 Tax=Pistacia integerrima TaxID=434235 RepID=A0ACC0WYP3_9ROSI|nr:hypothetical protein Pint_29556 [Pistacia integerrima]
MQDIENHPGFPGHRDANFLIWKERINIAIDAAKGLECLHNLCRPFILHRDLKTSNILLDKKKQAKLADFGLSRAVTESGPNSTNPAGTPGYMDPTFWNSGVLSRRTDIYSFGIILFELITGKPVINEGGQESPVHILEWVGPLVDPRFEGEFNANAVWKMVNIANLCTQRDGDARPGISHILAELKECLAIEMNPGTTCMTDSLMSASSNLPEEPPSDHGLQLAVIPW